MDEAGAYRRRGGSRPRPYPEFCADAGDVVFHRSVADAEPLGDGTVRRPRDEQREDLSFPWRQSRRS